MGHFRNFRIFDSGNVLYCRQVLEDFWTLGENLLNWSLHFVVRVYTLTKCRSFGRMSNGLGHLD